MFGLFLCLLDTATCRTGAAPTTNQFPQAVSYGVRAFVFRRGWSTRRATLFLIFHLFHESPLCFVGRRQVLHVVIKLFQLGLCGGLLSELLRGLAVSKRDGGE